MNSLSFGSKEDALEFAKVLNEKGVYASLQYLPYWDKLTSNGPWIVIWSDSE